MELPLNYIHRLQLPLVDNILHIANLTDIWEMQSIRRMGPITDVLYFYYRDHNKKPIALLFTPNHFATKLYQLSPLEVRTLETGVIFKLFYFDHTLDIIFVFINLINHMRMVIGDNDNIFPVIIRNGINYLVRLFFTSSNQGKKKSCILAALIL